MDLEKNEKIRQIALLVSCASVLQIAESLLPNPFPGIRLGLANVITIVSLVNFGFRVSVEIAVLRSLISSFILGTFLSPSFILSFSGALLSSIVMGVLFELSNFRDRKYFSLVGISLFGSITHNLVQISLVYILFIKHKGIFFLVPWLAISAVIMGWFTGILACRVCRKLERLSENSGALRKLKELKGKNYAITNGTPAVYIRGSSALHLLSPSVKIVSVIILSLVIIFSQNLAVYTIILTFLFALLHISKTPHKEMFYGLKRIAFIMLFSFIVPVLFEKGGRVMFSLGIFTITSQGTASGIIFVYRLLLLAMTASLLMKTTSCDELSLGIKKVLYPFKILGISPQRTANVIALSLSFVPVFLDRVSMFLKIQKLNTKVIKEFLPALSGLITAMYLETGNETEPPVYQTGSQ